MSFTVALFAPLMILLPVAGVLDEELPRQGQSNSVLTESEYAAVEPIQFGNTLPENQFIAFESSTQHWQFFLVAEGLRESAAQQVRIEQRMTVRITPFASPVRPDMMMDLPRREIGPRFIERNIGNCLPISAITGVQTNGGNRLILFMRDRRIVSAQLERACRARDFYSGFYLTRSTDGQLCVKRDTLLSRSGANCQLTRIRQLVEVGN